LIADLVHTPKILDDTFDCVILTQVLHVVYDFVAVVATLRRILKRGGVALLILPSITQVQQDYEWPFFERNLSQATARERAAILGSDGQL
jgi:ubiquinone/menaquinone biosynthesis C-methylase UbiE